MVQLNRCSDPLGARGSRRRRHVEHLPLLHVRDLGQGPALMAILPARLAAALLPQRLRLRRPHEVSRAGGMDGHGRAKKRWSSGATTSGLPPVLILLTSLDPP